MSADPHPIPAQLTHGRWVTLSPVRPVDYEAIQRAELSDALGIRWRQAGMTPSPEGFARALWAGVLVQFLVVANRDRRLLGIVSAYDADLRSGTCAVGFARFDPADRSPGVPEGVMLMVDHLFAHWTFRKLYGETLEYNLPNLGGVLGSLLVEEGRLRQHTYAGGRYWDLFHLALYRDTWEAQRDRLLPPPEAGAGRTPPQRAVSVVLPGGWS